MKTCTHFPVVSASFTAFGRSFTAPEMNGPWWNDGHAWTREKGGGEEGEEDIEMGFIVITSRVFTVRHVVSVLMCMSMLS